MISWGATKYFPGGHGTFIGNFFFIDKNIMLYIYLTRCNQFFCAYYYVYILHVSSNGPTISKISLVEKVHH